MKALKLQVLDASDRDILDQYVCVTRPIAFYLDVMQKEKNSFLGCVIPTIQKIGTDLTKLDFQEKSFGGLIRKGLWEFILKRWCYYFILLSAFSHQTFIIYVKIVFRFTPICDRNTFKLATSTHPRFKLNWCVDTDAMTEMRRLLELEMEKFESSLQTTDTAEDELDLPTKSSEALTELGLFLMNPGKDLDILHKYPRVKSVFLRYNTGLLSSGPVERLFCHAGPMILSARRNRTVDELFEDILILKVYKNV